jgi:glycosyltransferase involved in cell wall biosynthesis
LWDVDFSPALFNRTGKYFIGRDLIEDQAALISHVRYGRSARLHPPTGWQAKAVARLITLDQSLVQRGWLRGFRPARRLLHLDPYTVLNTRICRSDAVLVHDLGPVTHPELFSPAVSNLYRRAYSVIAEIDPRLVFVSMASATAYAAIYGNPRDGRVIYPPLREDFGRSPSGNLPQGVNQPFLLTVGSVGRRKNQKVSIEAFAQSGLAADGMAYVLCGAREPGAEEVVALAEVTRGVVLLNYVSDSELGALYRDAAGFVLVSQLEGFGVPVAEAITSDLIPLVSANSVLEEVAGEGALTASPDDISAIAQGMHKLAEMAADEKAQRRALLAGSVARFTRQRFANEWCSMLLGQRQDRL